MFLKIGHLRYAELFAVEVEFDQKVFCRNQTENQRELRTLDPLQIAETVAITGRQVVLKFEVLDHQNGVEKLLFLT
ncbi:hypothetical protein D3C75_1309290 [compost metagenome]